MEVYSNNENTSERMFLKNLQMKAYFNSNQISKAANEMLVLLPPIRAAEIVECVRKYMDGSSLKSGKLEFLLTRSSHGVLALMEYG